jgi:hypothetical protein
MARPRRSGRFHAPRPRNVSGGTSMVADDGDLVRGLGFVAMYSAWLEEEVDELLRALDPIEPFDDAAQRWPISRKLTHTAALVRRLDSAELGGLPEALEGAGELFERRNAVVHGRIYAGHDKIDYVQPGRRNVPLRPIDSAELYTLANEFWDYRGHFIGPMVFRVPRAVGAFVDRARLIP